MGATATSACSDACQEVKSQQPQPHKEDTQNPKQTAIIRSPREPSSRLSLPSLLTQSQTESVDDVVATTTPRFSQSDTEYSYSETPSISIGTPPDKFNQNSKTDTKKLQESSIESDDDFKCLTPPRVSASDTEYSYSVTASISNRTPSVPVPPSPLSIYNDYEDHILQQNGYEKIEKLCDTQQGELLEASVLNSDASDSKVKNVVIKKVCKSLHVQHIARPQIENGMTYCIPNNVVKEAMILRHLSVANRWGCVVQFVDFFECSQYYYLVVEYLDHHCMNLKQFVDEAHRYMHNGQLQAHAYHKVIKFIFWQLFVSMQWMHGEMHCCHLDLKLEHVMLKGAQFAIDAHTHLVTMKHNNIEVKICDFGSSELFRDGVFACDKEFSILREPHYLSPLLADGQTYDARKADIWSLGVMLFYCLHPSEPIERCLKIYNSRTYADLLQNMLKIDECKRYLCVDILQHKWFKSYYDVYKDRIAAKAQSQKLIHVQLMHLPYYIPIQML